jgi:hypothetical protein
VRDLGVGPIQLGRLARSPLLIVQPPSHDRSLVLMTMPADLMQLRVDSFDGHVSYAFDLLGEHLEKGVIRRAQIGAWLVPRDTDQLWALRLYRQFLADPPPLTV